MTTSYIRFSLLCVFLFLGLKALTQQSNTHFFQPQLFFTLGEASGYTANFGLSSRHEYADLDGTSFDARFLEVAHFSSLGIGNGQKIGLGLMYRFSKAFDDNKTNEFRLTQQYHFISRLHSIRFSHRFRLEERFFSQDTFIRLRYRFGLDFPLNGQKLNVKEIYSLVQMESQLTSHKSVSPRYDLRVSGGLGKWVHPKLKVQLTLQHRFDQLGQQEKGKWFVLLGGYIKI